MESEKVYHLIDELERRLSILEEYEASLKELIEKVENMEEFLNIRTRGSYRRYKDR